MRIRTSIDKPVGQSNVVVWVDCVLFQNQPLFVLTKVSVPLGVSPIINSMVRDKQPHKLIWFFERLIAWPGQ